MKLGLRQKMIALLAAVALLPLLAALVTISVGWDRLRRQSAGQAIVSVTQAEVLSRRVSLQKDIQRFGQGLREEEVVGPLKARKKLPTRRLRELDLLWSLSPRGKGPQVDELDESVAAFVRRLAADDPSILTFFVTDQYGQLVASTGHTTDYDQSDEEWWRKAYNQGRGQIYIPGVVVEEEGRAPTLNVCIPIMDGKRAVGVARLEMDLKRWMMVSDVNGDQGPGNLMLLQSNGVIVYRQGVEPMTRRAPNWTGDITHFGHSGWRVEGGEFQAYTPLRLSETIDGLPVQTPQWILVLYEPEAQALGQIWWLAAQTLALGLLLIGMLFLGGWWLIDRMVVRRVLRMQQTVGHVARGDLSQRLPAAPRQAPDEIDQLGTGLNQMIDQVQKSTQALQSANQLKSDFIRIAGHELRTPVSYILGMARLLKDNTDAARLQFGLQSMGAKAKRLNEIIQAMFKLMPERLHREDLHYQPVNLAELMEEIYTDIFPFLEKRNQRLVIELDALPELEGDRDKIRDVIENLLMNAIKFTPDGGIVRIRGQLQLGDRVAISVQDQGPGISEQEYPRLFQPFYGGSDVMTHSTGDTGYQKRGIGLGLAIVRHFVELHRGTIHVASSPLGSTFTFTLPIRRPGKSEDLVTDAGLHI